MSPLLSVKNLEVEFLGRYRNVSAVRGVSFEVDRNEIVGIVGESGSGKSATAKAIARLLAKHNTSIKGSVEFEGRELLSLQEYEMQQVRGHRIGMIFQDPLFSLNPTMKVGDQIGEGIRRHFPKLSSQEVRAKTIKLLDDVGIASAATRVADYPHMLSGGMRQRIMIAIALACSPSLLIADEPTTALDVTVQAQILDLLRSLQSSYGMSILLITHDLSLVAGFCERVLVMYGGTIVESSSVGSLFGQPQHPYTQGLLRSIPRLDTPKNTPLIPIPGVPPNLSLVQHGCVFAPRCPNTMRICEKQAPDFLSVSQEHGCACWLQHKNTSLKNYEPTP